MQYIDTNGFIYSGDRQYTIIEGELVWDTEITIEKPEGNYVPIVEDRVHVGWQEIPKTLEEQIEAIETKYSLKFELLQKRLSNVTLSNSIDQEAKTIILQNEYQEISNQMDLELIEVLGGI